MGWESTETDSFEEEQSREQSPGGRYWILSMQIWQGVVVPCAELYCTALWPALEYP